MSGYVEGLLRPADELLSTAMFGLACVSVTFFPQCVFIAGNGGARSGAVPVFVCHGAL